MAGSEHIMDGLTRAGRSWRRWLQQVLVGTGITLPQLEVLRALEGGEALNPSRIATLLEYDRPTMSCVLRALTEADWVSVRPNPVNAKYRDVRLVARGRAKLDEIAAHLALSGRRRFDPMSCLDPSEQLAIAGIIEKLNTHLARAPWRGVTGTAT
jgi:DNA-binding MarR family transcriptional regulator